jgi:hypothetical protein
MCLGLGGIESHGLLQLLASGLILLQVGERDAQVVARVVVVGIKGDGGLQMFDGGGILLGIAFQNAGEIERIKTVGMRRQKTAAIGRAVASSS